MLDGRADVVGSLLRPPELLEARRQLASGRLAAPEFKRIEDKAVDDAVAPVRRSDGRSGTGPRLHRQATCLKNRAGACRR